MDPIAGVIHAREGFRRRGRATAALVAPPWAAIKADVVLSDMAAPTRGTAPPTTCRIMQLVEACARRLRRPRAGHPAARSSAERCLRAAPSTELLAMPKQHFNTTVHAPTRPAAPNPPKPPARPRLQGQRAGIKRFRRAYDFSGVRKRDKTELQRHRRFS